MMGVGLCVWVLTTLGWSLHGDWQYSDVRIKQAPCRFNIKLRFKMVSLGDVLTQIPKGFHPFLVLKENCKLYKNSVYLRKLNIF